MRLNTRLYKNTRARLLFLGNIEGHCRVDLVGNTDQHLGVELQELFEVHHTIVVLVALKYYKQEPHYSQRVDRTSWNWASKRRSTIFSEALGIFSFNTMRNSSLSSVPDLSLSCSANLFVAMVRSSSESLNNYEEF